MEPRCLQTSRSEIVTLITVQRFESFLPLFLQFISLVKYIVGFKLLTIKTILISDPGIIFFDKQPRTDDNDVSREKVILWMISEKSPAPCEPSEVRSDIQ